MSSVCPKGIFIAIEGVDRSGKSTQAKLLEQKLASLTGKLPLHVRFPDRTTSIGKGINQYLEGKVEMEAHANHLLFTANRWELQSKMIAAINEGRCVIADRYIYSGIAYTAAKPNPPDWDWCHSVEKGLLKADCVICLFPNSIEDLEGREGYGAEIFENKDFQLSVLRNYQKLAKEMEISSSNGADLNGDHIQSKAVVNGKGEAAGQQWHWVAASGKSIEDIHNCIISFLDPLLVDAALIDEKTSEMES